ncbi:rhoptry protein rop9 [Cystoisospora suis]|uniref:Rhoptry protein rop9 n=1 Tax=Cystoisospora suis TaxID=483139 RepID=A0A2C6KDW4_9APIC|nr:rhoptry protein rop9 [Cystoisospora suis]
MPEGSLRHKKFPLYRFSVLQRTVCFAVPLLFVLSPLSCSSNERLPGSPPATGDSPNGEEASFFSDAFRALRASLARSLPHFGTVNETSEAPLRSRRAPTSLPGLRSLHHQNHPSTIALSSEQGDSGTVDAKAKDRLLDWLAKHFAALEFHGAKTMAPVRKHPCLQQLSKDVEAIKHHGLKGEEAAKAFVDALQRCGVQVVATDYDRTLISLHSGGRALSTNLAILQALAPDFQYLGEEIKRRNMPLVVVTFSDWHDAAHKDGRLAAESLVLATLKESKARFGVDAVYGFYPAYYTEPEEFQPLGLKAPMSMDKLYHIGRASQLTGVPPENIVLIDDDLSNCLSFFKKGGLAVHVKGDGFAFDNVRVITSSSLLQ